MLFNEIKLTVNSRSQMVPDQVFRDRKQVRFEVFFRIDSLFFKPDSYKDFLNNLFGIDLRGDDSVGKTFNFSAVFVKQYLESEGVTVFQFFQKLLLRM